MAGGSKSKRKGNGAELELCKLLGAALGGTFTRVPNSGAFTGGKNAARKANLSETQMKIYKGDIIPPDHLPKLVLESKFYAEFPWHQLLSEGPVLMLDDWIKQALDAVDPGDEWFVCFKINRRGWYITVPEVQAQHYAFGNHVIYTGAHGLFRVTALDDFLAKNTETVLRRAA